MVSALEAASAEGISAPQLLQNLPLGWTCPQAGQARGAGAGAPHSWQKRAAGPSEAPQFVHVAPAAAGAGLAPAGGAPVLPDGLGVAGQSLVHQSRTVAGSGAAGAPAGTPVAGT